MKVIAGLLIGVFALAPAYASMVFIDNTFNLTDYASATYQTGGATITTSQTAAGGNPGAALQTTVDTPFASLFYTSQYLLNSAFIYDPATQGTIQSIDFAEDIFVSFNGNFTTNGTYALLSQNGNYYANFITASPVQSTWQTGAASGLLAANFGRITDLTTRAVDSSSHPNFASGAIQFGTVAWTVQSGGPLTFDERLDNLSYTVNAVPLPAAAWLIAPAFGLMAPWVKRRHSPA